MRTRRSRAERAEKRLLSFRACPDCVHDFVTGEGERSCNYGACPYLPEELEVHCPTCWYNFYTREGRPECSDPPSCGFARQEAPPRVAAVTRWLSEQSR